jgi:plasmid stability protein
MIQIRNVPDEIHRTLKVRAAEAGMSLSEYLLRELRSLAGRPTFQEVRERIESHDPVPGVDAAALIRSMRGELPES